MLVLMSGKRTGALVAYSRILSLYLFETTDENCEIPSHSRNPELQVCLSVVLPFGFLRISQRLILLVYRDRDTGVVLLFYSGHGGRAV
jgi:hypothetical protein